MMPLSGCRSEMAKPILKFKKSPRYPHQRSEGLTRRGATRQHRLMTGLDLDRAMRQILTTVTPETVLHSTAALVGLGFGALMSYQMVEKILLARRATP